MQKKRPQAATWFWIGAAVALALGLVWAFVPRPAIVETALIDRGEVRQEIIDEGRTRIRDVYQIDAPVTGRLQRIEAEPGDAVKKGDILAVIVPADPAMLDARLTAELRAVIAAAQAAVSAADADLKLAELNFERAETLNKKGVASEAALDQRRRRPRRGTIAGQTAARRIDPRESHGRCAH